MLDCWLTSDLLCSSLFGRQEEKAIAEGVRVRDAWDGSIQDIELEVTGFHRQQFTEEEERAAVESAVGATMQELSWAEVTRI